MIAGKDAFTPGEAKNSWLTGTAAWNYFAISQYILGVRPEYNGLVVDPCIPAEWPGFKVTRIFRGVKYHIEVENPSSSNRGVRKLIIDDREIEGNLIPLFEAGSVHYVKVVLEPSKPRISGIRSMKEHTHEPIRH